MYLDETKSAIDGEGEHAAGWTPVDGRDGFWWMTQQIGTGRVPVTAKGWGLKRVEELLMALGQDYS
jgi:hypothetical protein